MRGITEVRAKEWIAGVVAGPLAGVNAALVLMLGGSQFLEAVGWIPFIGIAVAGGLVFPVVMAKGANPAAYSVIFVTSISGIMRSIVGDLVRIFGLVSLSTYISFVFVFWLWVAAAVVVAPLASGALDAELGFPHLQFSTFFGFMVYALFLGSFYGFTLQDYL
ncbi:MAG: hypothetical protein ACLFMT_02520 [Halobacteriales archaeon]